MKITVKTLRQEVYQVESEESDTVRNLKEKLELLSNYTLPVNRMKLIYSGLILEDEKLLSEYNIDEQKFMVVMIRPESNNLNHSSIRTTSQSHNRNLTETTNDVQQVQPTQQRSPSVSRAFEFPQSLTDPIEIENAICNIMDALRFSRNEVEQAFNMSFNNPDRAVDYLLHGSVPLGGVQNHIETNLSQMANGNEQCEQLRDTHSRYQQTIRQNMTNTLGSNQQQIQNNHTEQVRRSSPLDFLRNNPQFQQMRMMLQQNPSMIDFVIQQIGETNVALLELISQNQEDFINMINEPIYFDNNPVNVNENDTTENGEITISTNDWNAIRRLMELGFTENECVEAYLACERNEELSANYLLSENDDSNDSNQNY